ncbi:TPA: hypothetical protein N0F65_000297 [Lagenidium giganteum]|uniref:HIT-type domain-containing protein n=1 Tax=Lagenidium giganteum TaxID=4803 RepID=A0AAV2Z8C4_9STRA|nr:TPA: hypothetical protein N0F65_000297 [Lagenidium giganteum]
MPCRAEAIAMDNAAPEPMEGVERPLKREREEEVSVEQPAQPPVCDSCGSVDLKYRCPRCERITCSLACCLQHKSKYDCNGKRDRTKYVPVKTFDDATLSSDFFFLEEVARSTNSAARSRSQMGLNVRKHGCPPGVSKKRKVTNSQAPVNPHIPADWLARFPMAVQLFAQHAKKRGVPLTLLAPGMSKRSRNTSYMDIKAKKLYWRIEWLFPSAETAVNLLEERASDALTPFELLGKYLDRTQDTVKIRSQLRQYAVPEWQNHLALLLRKEFTGSPEAQYYELDGSLSLESNLKRKAVVEFPIIHVVLKTDLDKYKLAHDIIEVVDTSASATENDDTKETAEVEGTPMDTDAALGSALPSVRAARTNVLAPRVGAAFASTFTALPTDGIRLNNLFDNDGAHKRGKRLGRGIGSGKGKTCGRGHKGQKARSGGKSGRGLGFEGGQTPIYQRVPKRGFNNKFATPMETVNLDRLQLFIDMGRIDASKKITMKELVDSGLVTTSRVKHGIKLLGRNAEALSTPIDIEVSQASESAIKAVEAAGGNITAVYHNRLALRALLKPHKFEVIPQFARPAPKKMAYYTDFEKRGYLSPEIQAKKALANSDE